MGEVAQFLGNLRFDAAWSSDLSRAVETAEALLAAQSNPPPLTVHRGLREISDGIYEGWTIAKAVEEDPRLAHRRDGPAPMVDFAPPRGESIRQVFRRQQAVASELVAGAAGRTVLIAGHGWALRLLAAALVGEGPERFWTLDSLAPASVSVAEVRDGSASITLWNQTGHLTGQAVP